MVPRPSTYSVCCQKNGQVLSSGKSGRISAVPDALPPGMYDQSARLKPYAVVRDFAPTPETNDAVFEPGCTPRMKLSACSAYVRGNRSGNARCSIHWSHPKRWMFQPAPQMSGLYGTAYGVSFASASTSTR